MRSARKLLVTAAAATAALVALPGCSGGEPAKDEPAARSSPSELARYTAAPGTAGATQSPAAKASAQCVKTAGMNAERLTAYLKELRGASGAYQSQGLTLNSEGLNFAPDATQRPCTAIEVKLTRYWVDLKQIREETPVSAARFEYTYTLIDVTSHKVGPRNGSVPDSAPPGGSDCQGSLSVVHVGDDITLRSLPSDLELSDTTTPVPVEVSADGVLSAVYVSPSGVVSC
ncbi:hypothetical protein [Streptomyces apricus]|uniref:Lipoprotein n=1 Tax=Streptomyces apricus TaxID=1828112 RepID=A0A5B0BBB5_9ACTN|nr:hypothetical protein [Streptomyces apricus]KAA0939394.1 hypothetical protein FGF04_12265 [Streptomyces apricus]